MLLILQHLHIVSSSCSTTTNPQKVIKAAFSLSEILVFGTKPVLKYENENLSNWNLATFSVISSREGELNPNLNVNKKSFC